MFLRASKSSASGVPVNRRRKEGLLLLPSSSAASAGKKTSSFATLLSQTLFPSPLSSNRWPQRDASLSSPRLLLANALRQRRLGHRSSSSFSRADFVADALVQHCSLQLTTACGQWSATDVTLGDELRMLLLSDGTAATSVADTSCGEDFSSFGGGGGGGSTAAAASASLLDVDAASVLALPSTELKQIIEQLRFIAPCSSCSAAEAAAAESGTTTEEEKNESKFIEILSCTITNNNDTDSLESLLHLPGSPTSIIPSHLYPALLAYSSPSVCVDLIERDAAARLNFVHRRDSSCEHHHHRQRAKTTERAPIESVLFLRLFGALLRNPALSRDQLFVAGHQALLTLLRSYSAQLPSTSAVASAGMFAGGGGCDEGAADDSMASGTRNGNHALETTATVLRNVVAVLLIRVSRLYGRSARALEFAELHRALSEGAAAWLVQLAPTLYWTWLLGATLDAARSSNGDIAFTKLLPPFMSPQDARARDLDIDALGRLWAAFVPHMEQAVAVAARFSDDSCRKVRTTCIRVAVLLDENDNMVGSPATAAATTIKTTTPSATRVAVARKMGVPLSYQRLLHVYGVWGYHSIFNQNSSSSSSSSADFSGSNLLDPKDAVSQTIRLFGVALRRGAGLLIVDHPAEYQAPLLSFIEAVLASKPFAVIESTAYLLQLLAERLELLEQLRRQEEGCSPAELLLYERERAGLTTVGRRVADWAHALLRAQGGGWELSTIAPTADALERLEVLPRSAFWWRCGCGAKNPSSSIRCTMCLRRDATSASHWTCAGKGCGARQFIEWFRLGKNKKNKTALSHNNSSSDASASAFDDDDASASANKSSKADHVKVRCVACGSQHPWLSELEKRRGEFVACSRCLEVQLPPKAMGEIDQQRRPLFQDLCGSGQCKTLKQPIHLGATAAESSSSLPSSSSNAADANNKTSSSSYAAHASSASSNSNSWRCPECSTVSSSPVACSTCGLLKDAAQSDTRMWACDDCGAWNFAGIARCHRYHICRGKKKTSQRPLPYVRWRCGCGAHNPMWRVGCGRCGAVGKEGNRSSSPSREGGGQQNMKKQSAVTLYTCPNCRTVPGRLTTRRLDPAHPARPGVKIVSCGHCGADHPRDLSILRSLHFERPCVSCGDWHTLPGFSPTAAPSKTVCCAHCCCETDASVEPFSRWSCQTCSYEEAKKRKTAELRQETSSSSSCSTSPPPPSKDYCWRTGYRCHTCGDLHPSLAFSVVRSGNAARVPNSIYDGVFLWKCQAPQSTSSNDNKQKKSRYHQPKSIRDDEDECNEDALLCCGAFNPSWETHCKQCGHMRFQPPFSSSSATTTSSSRSGVGTSAEIRARYIPWSCDACRELQAPEEVVQCSSCFHPRVPPACQHCGKQHISLVCPASFTKSRQLQQQQEGKTNSLQP